MFKIKRFIIKNETKRLVEKSETDDETIAYERFEKYSIVAERYTSLFDTPTSVELFEDEVYICGVDYEY